MNNKVENCSGLCSVGTGSHKQNTNYHQREREPPSLSSKQAHPQTEDYTPMSGASKFYGIKLIPITFLPFV